MYAVPTGAIRSSAGVDLSGSAGVEADTGGAAGGAAGGGCTTAGDGAEDRAKDGAVPVDGRTNELLGAVYGFGVGFAAGVETGAGADEYFDPLDSFIRLRICWGVISASFRAWMTMCEFLRNEEIWEA